MDDATHDRIAARIATYNARLAELRADNNLSPLGKRNGIVSEYDRAKADVAKLRNAAADVTESRRSSLQRTLFGLPTHASATDVVSFRDAQDRVDKVKTAEDLGAVMQRASANGDEMLLTAAAAKAYELSRGFGGGGYHALLDAYVEERPAAAGPLREFQELNTSASLTQDMALRMATSVPKPMEVNDRSVLPDVQPRRIGGGFSIPGQLAR